MGEGESGKDGKTSQTVFFLNMPNNKLRLKNSFTTNSTSLYWKRKQHD